MKKLLIGLVAVGLFVSQAQAKVTPFWKNISALEIHNRVKNEASWEGEVRPQKLYFWVEGHWKYKNFKNALQIPYGESRQIQIVKRSARTSGMWLARGDDIRPRFLTGEMGKKVPVDYAVLHLVKHASKFKKQFEKKGTGGWKREWRIENVANEDPSLGIKIRKGKRGEYDDLIMVKAKRSGSNFIPEVIDQQYVEMDEDQVRELLTIP